MSYQWAQGHRMSLLYLTRTKTSIDTQWYEKRDLEWVREREGEREEEREIKRKRERIITQIDKHEKRTRIGIHELVYMNHYYTYYYTKVNNL